ncbi:class I adenylate-forming enzyme family protein [Streptosporangium carneum]|uniref:Fatty acid--CoA ligase n=1 Tax=Streptosporangium carneum TaxID=47481 RepID=A0A9W6MFZ0_9ACTN|nr:AMP-binding protein [Streptosporangium carneum]GLK12612.1 fatty acid--CoA ligase [Streptosporangium carneum]
MTTRDEAVARLTAPGSAFEIRVEEVLGERMEVFAHRQRSLGELLRASAGFGGREYLVTENGRLTYAEHHAAVAALGTALRDEYGVGKGDRVAICSANNPEWIIAFWAAVSLGAIAVGMNSMWAGPEIDHGLELTEPKVLIADRVRRELAGEPGIPVLSVEEDVPALIARHAGAALPDEPVDEDDPVVILFTSGTTGWPKGATHSHRNVIAACWFHLLNDAVAAETGRPQADRRYLLATPLFHIAALHNLAVVRLAVGDTAVVHLGRFDLDRVLRLIERERVTNWGAVPTMLSRLVEHGDLAKYDLGSLRTVSVSSAPSSPALKARLREVLPVAGGSLGTTYGLTESSTAATLASAAELLADPETVGAPVPTMEVEVRDGAGDPVPDGVEGEICLRGAQMMLGYWRNPEATAASNAPRRWFRTGDLGTMTGGRLRVSSRRSDLILRGGENVYPAEVEHRLSTHPAVRECIVLGAPHPDFGEEVAAVVVVAPGATVTEDELREHTRARIARYKVPTRWVITTEELPRNATGKVNRGQVELT